MTEVVTYEVMPGAIFNPIPATAGSAGYDLSYYGQHAGTTCILAGGQSLLGTGVKVEIPRGMVGLICSRSGRAKDGLVVANGVGVIDSDYRGELMVLLHNRGRSEKRIWPGDRIAQLVIIPLPRLDFVQGSVSPTERGDGGFGSTG